MTSRRDRYYPLTDLGPGYFEGPMYTLTVFNSYGEEIHSEDFANRAQAERAGNALLTRNVPSAVISGGPKEITVVRDSSTRKWREI